MKRLGYFPILALIFADVVAFFCAFFTAIMITWFFRAERIGGSLLAWCHIVITEQLVLYLLLGIAAIGVMAWRGHYTLRIPFWDELLQLIKLFALFCLLNSLIVLLIKLPISRFLFPLLWAGIILFVALIRTQVRHYLYRVGCWVLPTVVIGAKAEAIAAYRALQSEPLLGFEVCGFVTPEKLANESSLLIDQKSIPLLSVTEKKLQAVIDQLQPVNIVIALAPQEVKALEAQIEQLGLHYRHIYMIPPLAGLPLFGVEALHFFSHDVLFLRIRNNLAALSLQVLKRIFDIVVSSTLLLLLCPLFIWMGCRIRYYGANVFFGHPRIGQHGKTFICYKFSSMVPNAQRVLAELLAQNPEAKAEWDRDFKLKNDPRVTPIGAFLRRTSLDELPQLWNVLKGEMSLVGPRPIIEEELLRYENKVDFYLCTRPGMTGLWQVSGRNDIDYSERVALDAWYVKNWNLWYDIAILFKTIKVVLKRNGAY